MVQPYRRASGTASRRTGGAAIGVSLALCAPAHGFPNLLPHAVKPPPATAATAASVAASPATSTRIGALPNGLRYAIVRTTNLPGKVSLRLRLAVGSLSEGDAERGFAQLLARAPFDGTKPAPGGELSDVARARGLSFTADGNADAAADATTFSLDLTAADPATLDTAVALLRGAAGEPKLAQSDLDTEWATVVAHEHAANDLANRMFRARLAFLLEGQRPAGAVGGLGDALAPRKVKRGPVAAFHTRFYRPDRAVLVVAGDVDVDAMENSIRAGFEAWRAGGTPGVNPAPGSIEQRGMQARVRVESGAPTSLQLSWIAPPDPPLDSPDKRRQDAIQRLALGVLNRRLSALADSSSAPFDSAAAFQETLFGAARVTSLLINAEPGHWRDALTAADQAQRAAIAFPPTADELSGARASVEADLQDSADTADTRPPALIADIVAADLATGDPITTPAEDLAAFRAATAAVTPDQITTVLKEAFTGQGPLLFVSTPTAIDGGDAAVASAFAAIHAQPVAAPIAPSPNPRTFRDFGEPGKIAERRDVIDLDTVFVRFENGVRLTIRPTKLKDGEVSVKVRVGGGLMAAPADRALPVWALPTLVDGVPVKIALQDDAMTLTGVTPREDLDLLLRALAGPIVAPNWRQDAFDRLQKETAGRIAKENNTATGVFAHALAPLTHDGDRRWTTPGGAEIGAVTLGEARRSFDPLLANGQIEVIVAGDITEDKAFDAVAATFGALPARSAPMPPAPLASAPGAPTAPVLLTHRGAGDDGLAATVWPTDDFFADPREARIVEVLTEILRARLADAGGEPHAENNASMVLPHVGFTSVSLQGPPAQLDGLLAREASAVGDLRARDVGSDELARAKSAVEEAEDTARRTNAHWLDLLSGAQDDARRLTAIRSQSALVERVTPADIRAAAQRYLRAETATRLEVRPGS
jgi:zinc protease